MGVRAKIKTSSPRALNAWLLFVTILVIVLSFCYYSFVYVKNNEKDQIAKRFRVLAQIGKNIVERKKGFESISRTALERARELEKIKEIEEKLKGLKNETDQKKQEEPPKKLIEELLSLTQKEIKKANEWLKADEWDKVDQKGSFQRDRLISHTWKISFKDKDGKTVWIPEVFYIYVNVNDFFEPLERSNVFDGLLIIQEEKKNIPENSEVKKKTIEVVGKVLYQDFPGHIDISDLNKLKNSQHGIESGCLRDIKISNTEYKLFLQPVKLDDEKKMYVGGLRDNKEFRGEARRLRSGVLTPLLIIFSIFILSIPLLKLFLMSKFEQMDIRDVVLTTIAVNFGTIALLLLFVYTFQVTRDTAEVQNNLSRLAKQIKKDFTVELRTAYEELRDYNSNELLEGYQLNCGDNFKDILTEPRLEEDSPPDELSKNGCKNRIEQLKKKLPPSKYPFFKGVFWMDDSGNQKLQFSTRYYGGKLINLESRKYFREAGNWKVPEADESDSSFMLQSITSMSSGENLAAISMKSDINLIDKEGRPVKIVAAAMTTQLTSVIDTIIPAGYGFCIIDKTGEVWFHSNTQRNLQENFISEVENDKALLSAISGNREKQLVLDYQDKTHKCFVMPVPDIPLYIVTFHDLRYTSALQVTIILHIVLFFIALALFTGLLFIVVGCCNYRKSLLKRKHDPFEWFKPLTKNKDAYQHLILSNLAMVLFLILFKLFIQIPPAETFFLCLSALLYSFTYNYYTIAGEDAEKYRLKNIRLLSFFLVFIFLVDLAAGLLLDKFILLLCFQVGLFIVLGLAKLSRAIFKPFEFLHSGHIRNWIRSYVLFLLSWLLVVGVIPVIIYYLDVHTYENKVALKHFQVKLAERIEDRDYRIEKFYKEKITDAENPEVKETKDKRKTSGRYSKIIGETDIIDKSKGSASANGVENDIFDKFAHDLKPPLSRVAAERRAFVFPAAADKSFTWYKNGENKLILKYKKKKFPFANNTNNKDDGYVYVESDMGYFKIPLEFFFLLFAAASFLLLVYFLVRFAARMVFGTNLPGMDNIKRTYTEAQDEICDTIKAGSDVIIYCPGSIEMKYCEDALNNPSSLHVKKISTIDLKSESGTLAKITESSKERLIIIKNFELHLNHTDKYLNNMNQVVSLLRSRNTQVVVLASIPLEEIIEFYEEKLNEVSSKEASPSDKEMKSQYKEIIDGLNEINEGFLPMYIPLKTMDEDRINDQFVYSMIEKIPDTAIRDLIKKEIQAAEYLKKIIPGVYRYYKYLEKKNVPKPEEKEEMILKIQELAQDYYNQLLSSCSKREKYILYDIAQDMFVNVNNLDAINILLRKGLLVYDGEFKLMNESFRNYILCSIDADELKQYVRKLYPKWRSYKAPLLFIALGVAVFLAFQGDLLSKVDALVATAVGGVAIFTNFSRVFLGYSKRGSATPAYRRRS